MGQTCHWNLTSADLKNAMRLAWFNLLSLAKVKSLFCLPMILSKMRLQIIRAVIIKEFADEMDSPFIKVNILQYKLLSSNQVIFGFVWYLWDSLSFTQWLFGWITFPDWLTRWSLGCLGLKKINNEQGRRQKRVLVGTFRKLRWDNYHNWRGRLRLCGMYQPKLPIILTSPLRLVDRALCLVTLGCRGPFLDQCFIIRDNFFWGCWIPSTIRGRGSSG